MERGQILFREMQRAEKQPLILTLRLDPESHAFFEAKRQQHFPPERNFLKAHFTLFHQLPDEGDTREYLAALELAPFKLMVTGLMALGGGVAYRVESTALQQLHSVLSKHFAGQLIPQDRQGFRPHIVVQNKVLPTVARELLSALQANFQPFYVDAIGLDLWRYLGGPWEQVHHYPFAGFEST